MKLDQQFLYALLNECELRGTIHQDTICSLSGKKVSDMDFPTYKKVSQDAVEYLSRGYFEWDNSGFKITLKGIWTLTKMRQGIFDVHRTW